MHSPSPSRAAPVQRRGGNPRRPLPSSPPSLVHSRRRQRAWPGKARLGWRRRGLLPSRGVQSCGSGCGWRSALWCLVMDCAAASPISGDALAAVLPSSSACSNDAPAVSCPAPPPAPALTGLQFQYTGTCKTAQNAISKKKDNKTADLRYVRDNIRGL